MLSNSATLCSSPSIVANTLKGVIDIYGNGKFIFPLAAASDNTLFSVDYSFKRNVPFTSRETTAKHKRLLTKSRRNHSGVKNFLNFD